MTKKDLDFDEWYHIVLDEVEASGIHGKVDHDTARNDYELGITPQRSAELFIKTMEDNA